MYSKVEYSRKGLPKCEICGKFFSRVGSHVRYSHGMTAKEYRIKFGLDFSQSLCSKESSAKSRKVVMRNYAKCVKRNLIECNTNKYTPGCHPGKYVSEQSRKRLTLQIAHTWKRPEWFDSIVDSNVDSFKYMVIAKEIFDEDIFQDSLFEAVNFWYRWNRKCKITSWLIGIYVNLYKRHQIKILKSPSELTEWVENLVYLEIESEVIRVDVTTLTAHETRFVHLLLDGKRVGDIAKILRNSPKSVKAYKTKLLKKLKDRFLDTYNRKAELQLVKKEYRNGFVQNQFYFRKILFIMM